jgi:hypothetical protein
VRLKHDDAGKTASPIEEGEALCRLIGHSRHLITVGAQAGVPVPLMPLPHDSGERARRAGVELLRNASGEESLPPGLHGMAHGFGH